MITADLTNDALQAIQSLIVQARHAAFAAGAKDVGALLDDMELLPEMLGDEQDQTQEFYNMLQGIGEKHPQCRHVVEQFGSRKLPT